MRTLQEVFDFFNIPLAHQRFIKACLEFNVHLIKISQMLPIGDSEMGFPNALVKSVKQVAIVWEADMISDVTSWKVMMKDRDELNQGRRKNDYDSNDW